MDVLGSVLQELRFESTEYRSLRLGAPFRISFAEPGLRGVHVVVEGECEVSVSGRPPRRLRAGDLVLFPRGDAHVLHSVGSVRGPTQSGVALAMATDRGIDVRAGGAGAETLVLCGAFVVTRHDHPALAALPEIVHVTEGSGRERWLAPYVDALSAEVFHGGPGSGVVMTRLSDALVARALRFHVESVQEPGLLLGLGDPYVAPALAAIHDDLAAPWTVASLAALAGVSRAVFAERFRQRVGISPGGYLLQVRMARASTLLRDERSTLRAVAAAVGYGSEAAFSAAFKRYTGTGPRALTGRPRCRRSARAGRRGARRARCSMPESPCW